MGPSPKTKVSPKRKISVLERKKALERKYINRLKEQKGNDKTYKESAKEKREKEKKKKEVEESDDESDDESFSLQKMMKIMMKDIKEVKGDMKLNGEKMENMNKKLSKLETKTKTNEEKYEKKFQDMQADFKKQIEDNNAAMEESISKKIIESLKPKITAMHTHIVETDLERIVEEKLQAKETPVDVAVSPGNWEGVEESNKETDIRVLIKRFSEGNYLPFRELSLNVLGAISP